MVAELSDKPDAFVSDFYRLVYINKVKIGLRAMWPSSIPHHGGDTWNSYNGEHPPTHPAMTLCT
ncbi:hypothetical protein GCM10011403_28680 [Pseudohongiella nitratireducens]|uniref:Uncharacterized protein n=1 Tax=Pseudohongiella nitratireducens TaxID=1768907 RepID=A0A916VKC1_9GAMM|nr:hypothetical protein GCM10011403_28680 [Pseudohongiella nitratireducens]